MKITTILEKLQVLIKLRWAHQNGAPAHLDFMSNDGPHLPQFYEHLRRFVRLGDTKRES